MLGVGLETGVWSYSAATAGLFSSSYVRRYYLHLRAGQGCCEALAAARCDASPGARTSHASAVARAHTAGRLCARVDGHVRKSVFGVLCQTGP
eukprot:2547692-Rhodomonas_salina.1